MTDLLLQDPHIPAPFRNIGYDDFDTTGHDGPTRREIYRTVRDWRPTMERPNLLLWGKPGLGKTFLASASLNERQWRWEFKTRTGKPVPKECLPALRQNAMPVYFIQLSELIELHKKSFDLKDRDEEAFNDLSNLLDGLCDRAKWLVVDDVGKEYASQTGFSQDMFDLLVRTRYNNGLYTIFTSNLPLDRWERCYSDSMRDFIERSSKIVKFT